MKARPIPELIPLEKLPLAREGAVSPLALALYRKIVSLSRRVGYACVKLLETLAGMLGKSVRSTRYALAELVAAGWIGRSQTRAGGVSKLFFWPCVRVAGRSRGLFSGRQLAACSAVYSPQSLPFTPSVSYKKAPVGKRDDNSEGAKTEALIESSEQAVAVSLLENVVSSHEAQELAREATRKQLSKEQIERVISAYRSQADKVRNRGAWLREAIRRGFAPAAPASTHASDQAGSVPAPKSVKVRFDAPPSKPEAFQSGEAARAAILEKCRLHRRAQG